MKTTASLILFFISFNFFAQSNRIYSISVNGGVIIPIENLSNSLKTGYNAGIEIETRKNNFAVFGSGKINQVETPRGTFDPYGMPIIEMWTYTIGEISAGGRWYLGNSKPLSANVDLAFSIYTGNFFQKIPWGVQPGIGGNFNITKKLSANLNIKANIIEDEDWVTYLGFYSGVRYNF